MKTQDIEGLIAEFAPAYSPPGILKDCWMTPDWLLKLACSFIGPFDCDPFWNPWSQTYKYMRPGEVTVYPGPANTEGCGVKDKNPWGRCNFVNGPFSGPAPWVARSALEGLRSRVAMLVPDRPAKWFRHVWDADVIIDLGRVRFTPPEGIKESSPAGGTMLCLWKPDGEPIDPTPRLIDDKYMLMPALGSQRERVL